MAARLHGGEPFSFWRRLPWERGREKRKEKKGTGCFSFFFSLPFSLSLIRIGIPSSLLVTSGLDFFSFFLSLPLLLSLERDIWGVGGGLVLVSWVGVFFLFLDFLYDYNRNYTLNTCIQTKIFQNRSCNGPWFVLSLSLCVCANRDTSMDRDVTSVNRHHHRSVARGFIALHLLPLKLKKKTSPCRNTALHGTHGPRYTHSGQPRS